MPVSNGELNAIRHSVREAYSTKALSAEQISRLEAVGFDFDWQHSLPVIELGSGKVFGSVREAARFAGVAPVNLRDTIGEKRLLKGYAFAYADGKVPDIGEYREPIPTGGRKVVELKSGKVFGSISEAARFAGVGHMVVRKAIDKIAPHARDFSRELGAIKLTIWSQMIVRDSMPGRCC